MRIQSKLFLASFLSIVMLFSACRTAQKFTESGDYDGAIDFCVHKLQGKSKKKIEYVQGLELAFQKAQTRDLNTCDRLIAEGRAENWEQVNIIHKDIADRQSKIAPLLPLTAKDGHKAQFSFVNIAVLEKESRDKAAEFLYEHAQTLLEKATLGDKRAAREAYQDLVDLERRYYREYKEKTALKDKARNLGTSYVLFEIKNQSGAILPRNFQDRVLAISKYDLDSEWKAYYFESKPGIQFDYKVVYKINNIDISPERIHERSYTDEKEIEDGWDYVLDGRGNVLKDTLGNDLKVKRYARIRATVLEIHQTKSARLVGLVEVFDIDRNTLLDNQALSTEVHFEHYASTFIGDRRALSQDSECRIGNHPRPFPMNEDLLAQAADRLKPMIREELRGNRVIY